jgi:hypothetical protein
MRVKSVARLIWKLSQMFVLIWFFCRGNLSEKIECWYIFSLKIVTWPLLINKKNKALVEYFGCDSEENRIQFLKALLVYEKAEDIVKDCSLDQVNIF